MSSPAQRIGLGCCVGRQDDAARVHREARRVHLWRFPEWHRAFTERGPQGSQRPVSARLDQGVKEVVGTKNLRDRAMTPEAFLRKFAGREVTHGDVRTLLGLDHHAARGLLNLWSKTGKIAAANKRMGPAGAPRIWRVLRDDSHFAQGEVRTPGGSGAHTPGCAVARQ